MDTGRRTDRERATGGVGFWSTLSGMPEPIPTPSRASDSADDPAELAQSTSLDELQRLKLAEELAQLRAVRKKSPSRLVIASQVLVGYIALAGFFVNAYQSYSNKQRQDEQARIDQGKWNQEFARASQADKYRAFFETAMLATDPTNADKRLVGYALLQEFVQDPTYEGKAMVMLEESLSQELRGGPAVKLDDAHRATVVAIVTALAETGDCRALQRAARSVDRVARRYARTKDESETRDVIDMYVRRLVGRAAQVCTTLKDFQAVRRPIRDTMLKSPDLLGLNAPSVEDANLLAAAILCQQCQEELAYSGSSDCPEVLRGYLALCARDGGPPREERSACETVGEAVASLPPAPALAPGAASPVSPAR
jgi:hypothetical protein